MDKKTIGLIAGIAAVLIVLVGAVSATTTDNSSEVTIFNETFHIPEGFNKTYSHNQSDLIEMKYSGDAGSISIRVVNHNDSGQSHIHLNPDELNRTIGNISGFYSYPHGEGHQFRYANGNNVIIIQSSNETLLEQIIK